MHSWSLDTDKYNCIICMGILESPVIGSDGNVYCEKCITQWNNSLNSVSPYGESKLTSSVKCPLFSDLCMITHINTDLNLFKLMDNPVITCDNIDDASLILDMIDKENDYRLKNDRNEDIVLAKIFSNRRLIKQIIDLFPGKMWIGRNNWTIMHYVCRFGDINLIEYVINHCVCLLDSPSNEGWCPVHFICSNSNNLNSGDQLLALRMMVEKNVALEVATKWKNKPINFICSDTNNLNSQDQLKSIILLVEKNVDLETEENEKPIHTVCGDENNLDSEDQCKAIQLLIEKNVNLEVTDSAGMRAMHFVCGHRTHLNMHDRAKIIKLLIEKNVDLEAKDNNGWRPIHYLCDFYGDDSDSMIDQRLSLIQLLVDKNIDTRAKANNGKDPVHIVLENFGISSDSKVKIIQLLTKIK